MTMHGFMIKGEDGIKLLKRRGDDKNTAERSLLERHPGITVVEYLGSGTIRELGLRADRYLSEKGLNTGLGYAGEESVVHA